MNDELDQALGRRLHLENYGVDEDFAPLLPRAGVVEQRLEAGNGVKDWYSVRLEETFEFEGLMHTHILIRARRSDVRFNDPGESSVFLLLVRDESALHQEPIDIRRFIHVGSGLAKVAFDRAAMVEEKRERHVERVKCRSCGAKIRATDKKCPDCFSHQKNPFSEEMTLVLKLAAAGVVLGVIWFVIFQLDPRFYGFIRNGSAWEKGGITFVGFVCVWAAFDLVVRRVFKR